MDQCPISEELEVYRKEEVPVWPALATPWMIGGASAKAMRMIGWLSFGLTREVRAR